MRRVVLGLIVVSVMLGGRSAYADVIYDNGGPDHANAFDMTHWIQAEDFVLGATTTITDVHFWSLEANQGYANSLTWFIYADNGGSPGTIVSSGSTSTVTRSLTGGTYFGMSEWVNEFTIPDFIGLGGVRYWLGLHNGPLSDLTRGVFFWETAADNGNNGRQQLAGSGPWANIGYDHAFYLTGNAPEPVPEPGTLALLGIGFGTLVARRRKRNGQLN